MKKSICKQCKNRKECNYAKKNKKSILIYCPNFKKEVKKNDRGR